VSPKVAKARLSCFLQFLLLPHSQPFLSCKQLHSFRLHLIQPFASSHIFIPFRLHSFQPLAVHRLLLIFGSPACRIGLRAVMLFVTSSISNDFIFINKKPASPCVASNIGRSRPHSLRSLRAFSASTLAPLAAARR